MILTLIFKQLLFCQFSFKYNLQNRKVNPEGNCCIYEHCNKIGQYLARFTKFPSVDKKLIYWSFIKPLKNCCSQCNQDKRNQIPSCGPPNVPSRFKGNISLGKEVDHLSNG